MGADGSLCSFAASDSGPTLWQALELLHRGRQAEPLVGPKCKQLPQFYASFWSAMCSGEKFTRG